jgi:hypothetical protein
MVNLDSDLMAVAQGFAEGKSVGYHSTSPGEEAWESAAFSRTVDVDEQNGVEVVGDATEDYLFIVSTDSSRPVDAEPEGREHLDQVVEYHVSVDVVDRNLEQPYDGTRSATILSGTPEQTSSQVWANRAVNKAYDDGDIDVVDPGRTYDSGEIQSLMPEEETEDEIFRFD